MSVGYYAQFIALGPRPRRLNSPANRPHYAIFFRAMKIRPRPHDRHAGRDRRRATVPI